MQKGKGFLLALATLAQTGCMTNFLGGDSKSSDYHFPRPGSGWTSIDPAGADAAYRNERDQSILNVSSNCGNDRYRSLEELTEEVYRQLPERESVEKPKATTVDGHPALVSEEKGKVDGNDLRVRLVVVRTEHCIYDIMLAGSQLDGTSRQTFDRAVDGFREGKAR